MICRYAKLMPRENIVVLVLISSDDCKLAELKSIVSSKNSKID